MSRDWHAERYAAGEELAAAAAAAMRLLNTGMLATPRELRVATMLDVALAEYERTKNAP